jgi:nucleotide-binding universal stress UspA family protein
MSLEIKNILCCIAMSPTSEYVLLRAMVEAQRHDADLHVLHIMPSYDSAMAVPIASFMGEEKFQKLIEEHKEETENTIRQEIDGLKKRILDEHIPGRADHIKGVHVYEGDPVLEIMNMTDNLKVDMIVIGAHTQGLSEYISMGSVARKVLREIKIPVLIVPPEGP